MPSTTSQGGYTLKADKKKKHADLELYGVVGWGINHQRFNYELKSYGELETITVRLNTIGGTFYDGLPIYNILKQHSAHVTIKVMGYALSMGSIIMLAGDKVEMAQNSLVMIHRAQGWDYGDAKQLRKAADRLEIHEEAILPDYQSRLNLSAEQVMELLQEETWYTAARALKAGLIDEITDPVDLEEADKQIDENAWEDCISNFNNMPEDFASRVQAHIQPERLSLMQRFINMAIGKPNPTLEQPDDIDMTPEELQQALSDNNQALLQKMEATIDEKLKAIPQSPNTDDDDDANGDKDGQKTAGNDASEARIKELEAQLEATQAELEELKEPEKGTTNIGENTGDNTDLQYDY